MKWMKAERSIIINDLDVSSSQWVLFNVQETGNYILKKYSQKKLYFSIIRIKNFYCNYFICNYCNYFIVIIMCNLLLIFSFFFENIKCLIILTFLNFD